MKWDWAAIRAGAAVSLVFAVPLAVGARIAADGDSTGLAIGLSIGAAQAVFFTIRIIRGEEVRWFGALFTLTFVLLAGLIGGLLGQRLQSAGIQPSNLAARKGS